MRISSSFGGWPMLACNLASDRLSSGLPAPSNHISVAIPGTFSGVLSSSLASSWWWSWSSSSGACPKKRSPILTGSAYRCLGHVTSDRSSCSIMILSLLRRSTAPRCVYARSLGNRLETQEACARSSCHGTSCSTSLKRGSATPRLNGFL